MLKNIKSHSTEEWLYIRANNIFIISCGWRLLGGVVAPRFAVGVVVGALGDGAGSIHHSDVIALVVGEVVERVAATVEIAAGEAGHLH